LAGASAKEMSPLSEFCLPSAAYHSSFAEQCRFFVEKFGRSPTAEDPVFFDPAADTPKLLTIERAEELLNEAADDMATTGKEPDLAYAAKKTSFLAIASLMHLLPSNMEREWEAARCEYFAADAVQ
jgi:hypothetical protein